MSTFLRKYLDESLIDLPKRAAKSQDELDPERFLQKWK
jgi:hypothetical protein